MSQYRILAHRRTYYCDAEDIASALRHFVANVPDAAVETIVDLAAEAEADRILAMTDAEIVAKATADGIDIKAEATKVRGMVAKAVRKHAETPQQHYVRTRGKVYPEPGTIDHKPLRLGALGALPAQTPCVECPLARASVPGRLGGYTVQQYLEILHSRADIACHLSPGFPKVLRTQRSCTGVAMYRANCGIKANGHAQAAIDHVGTNAELVFASRREFRAHHTLKTKD